MTPRNSAASEMHVDRVLRSKESARSYYNKIAGVYDLLAESSEAPMREAGLKKLAAAPGEKMLEIGFGTGHCLVKLAQAVGSSGQVIGLDISDKMVEQTRQLLEKEQLQQRVALYRGDAEDLPLPDGSVDGIFMSFTLELFDTPEIPRVLAECRRVLRPGGRLVVVSVSKGDEGIMVDLFEWTHRHFPNLVDCRPIYVRQTVEEAGFEVESAEIKSMWVPVEIVLARKTE